MQASGAPSKDAGGLIVEHIAPKSGRAANPAVRPLATPERAIPGAANKPTNLWKPGLGEIFSGTLIAILGLWIGASTIVSANTFRIDLIIDAAAVIWIAIGIYKLIIHSPK